MIDNRGAFAYVLFVFKIIDFPPSILLLILNKGKNIRAGSNAIDSTETTEEGDRGVKGIKFVVIHGELIFSNYKFIKPTL